MGNKAANVVMDYQANLEDIRGARGAITQGRTSMKNALDILALEGESADLDSRFKCFLLTKVDFLRERLKTQAQAEVIIEQRYLAMHEAMGKLQAILRRHDLAARQSGRKKHEPEDMHRQPHALHEVRL